MIHHVFVGRWCTLALLASVAMPPMLAADPPQIAGKTLDQYTAELDDESRVVRLRAIKSIGAFGPDAGDVLAGALGHDDAAMRYTAARHLGRIGGESLNDATSRLVSLAKKDSSLAVRVAASFALCRAGRVDEHLPLMIETLHYPERGMVCSTAELIGDIGPPANEAVEVLDDLYDKNRPGVKGGDYHVGGAVMNALRKIKPAQYP